MNEVTKYGLWLGLGVCGLVFVACAVTTLLLIPFAFGQGFRAFSATKDLRDIVAVQGEAPWVLQVYCLLRKLQGWAGVGAIAFAIATVVFIATGR